jgi:transposase
LAKKIKKKIKSAKISMKFCNTGKVDLLRKFIAEYRILVAFFVDLLWELKKVPVLIPKELTSKAETWLSARAIQAAAKQASGIVRGAKKKQEQREYRYSALLNEKKFKQARKLRAIIDSHKVSKPVIDNICPELDSRFVEISWDSSSYIDGWLTLSSLGFPHGTKIVIPIKKHKHFNKMLAAGKIKTGVRLSNDSITFMFDVEEPVKVEEGSTLGIDIGVNNVISVSDGFQSVADKHGWTLDKIMDKMCLKKPGSKAYARLQALRINHTNWCANQVNLSGVKQVYCENIFDFGRNVRSSKKLRRWPCKNILDKLEDRCLNAGVQFSKSHPAFTSQRCSSCGWVQRANRKDSTFKCKSCGHTQDADLNAALNISFNLPSLGKDWRKLPNKKGFYWLTSGREFIVPDTQETDTCLSNP